MDTAAHRASAGRPAGVASLVGFVHVTVAICTAVVLSVTVVGLPVLAGGWSVPVRSAGRSGRGLRPRSTYPTTPSPLQAPAHPAAVDVGHGPSTALWSSNESAPQTETMPDTRSS
ncbi:hypothetical protein ABZ208_05630 [Streptomyces sp. NPDC006208]|uniref:hypothetical protein n=1 Tax=Streptomyces sp. NPDC006208 TaxID=3156734 RepID=UPI0033BC75C9